MVRSSNNKQQDGCRPSDWLSWLLEEEHHPSADVEPHRARWPKYLKNVDVDFLDCG